MNVAVIARAAPNRRARRATVMARARLRSDLRSIVFDVLGLCDAVELPAETAAWVDNLAEIAVTAVCDSSMNALLESIDAALAEAPPSVVARLAQASTRHDAGID
jgi:hypothetical protein